MTSLGETYYKLTTIIVLATFLLAIWLLLGQTKTLSIYTRKGLNYLELFYYFNLALFSIYSAYLWFKKKEIEHKQTLGVIMVGSVFFVSCGIVLYRMCRKISRIKKIHTIIYSITNILMKAKTDNGSNNIQNITTAATDTTTHSIIELKECIAMPCELREPLLTDQ